jgi:tRNA pseudouridine38-40 synthase
MRNIKLTIQYDGSKYRGWQRLGDSDQSIQGKLENVLSKMAGENTEIIGAGRTDAGVHAENQTANFKTNSHLTLLEMLDYCYKYLPEDIVVKRVEEMDPLFHSRYNAREKIYKYRICNKRYHDVFDRKYSYHVNGKLDIKIMKEAAKYFIGEHDFTSFTSMKSKKKSAIREVYSIDIIKTESGLDINFRGNGFLYNMVRIITGTLIEIGLGNIPMESIPEIMDKKDRSLAGPTAPAQGLFLMEVIY